VSQQNFTTSTVHKKLNTLPNQTAEQSINMAESGHEEEEDQHEEEAAPVMPDPPAIPGVSPEIYSCSNLCNINQQTSSNL
jgi:hypothetical protein